MKAIAHASWVLQVILKVNACLGEDTLRKQDPTLPDSRASL